MKRKPTVPEESEQDITIEELESPIDQSKKNKDKESGKDDISYELLNTLGPKANKYNKCWDWNGIPVK